MGLHHGAYSVCRAAWQKLLASQLLVWLPAAIDAPAHGERRLHERGVRIAHVATGEDGKVIMTSRLPAVRRLRDENKWGARKISAELGISKDQATRLLNKLKLEDAQAGKQAGRQLSNLANGQLSKFDIARQALAEAKSLSEVMDIADKSIALKEYYRRADDRTMEINSAELHILAERKAGELLLAMEAAGEFSEGRPPKNGSDGEPFRPRHTIESLGIDKKFSARSQKLASISERAMALRLATWREAAERGAARVTVNLLRDGDKRERRAARESHLGERQAAANLKLPDKRYGVILADPEWRFEPWSRETGLDRSPDNHYPTSVTEVIAARPVADIAAKDCALFLWATVPMLPHALAVMAAWGFDYRSHVVWKKDRMGTGYWFRNFHELLLLGIKGSVPAPAPGDQWGSMLEAAVSEHSEKPNCFHAMIEAHFPHLPKIELNARRARPNWDSWGLDAPNAEAAE